jgi:hypothetical protein
MVQESCKVAADIDGPCHQVQTRQALGREANLHAVSSEDLKIIILAKQGSCSLVL